MSGKIHEYQAEAITVRYDVKRCIHAEECVKRLSAVFNPKQRLWIQPANASADQIAETVSHCPTGALHYERNDGGAPEATPTTNTIHIDPDGALYLRGDIEIIRADGATIIQEVRVALCRCGASENKPFCDNTHQKTGFQDPGLPAERPDDEGVASGGRLTVRPSVNGPLAIEGNFEVISADGRVIYRGKQNWFCRCGNSHNKPFCDKTHRKIGFVAD
jgi:CDGSH-type Zn-finger protein/uncharacterized Fe-S cluster protein YjdI